MTRTYYPGGMMTIVQCDHGLPALTLAANATARNAKRDVESGTCAAEFRSTSVRSMIGKQLAHAQWLTHEEGAVTSPGRVTTVKRDLCDAHALSVRQPITYAAQQAQAVTNASKPTTVQLMGAWNGIVGPSQPPSESYFAGLTGAVESVAKQDPVDSPTRAPDAASLPRAILLPSRKAP